MIKAYLFLVITAWYEKESRDGTILFFVKISKKLLI